MKAEERFTADVIRIMREKIKEHDGAEVVFCGLINEDGLVSEITTVASGHETAAPAPAAHMRDADVVIHNHPSGVLRPSSADIATAAQLGRDGIGSYIVDNLVTRVTVTVEPYSAAERVEVDGGSLVDFCESEAGLSKFIGDYEYRESQSQMMKAVAEALNKNRLLVVEAGTGIGKSLAYLIPSVKWAQENKSRGGDRIVVSTATITLQDQLIQKDLPLALKILNADVKYVLMKGRNNYLCLRRFDEELVSGTTLFEEEADLESLREWSLQTATGDFSELTFPLDPALKSRVCSESDNCLAVQCPFYEKCFVFNLRKEAASAQIIVVNNHLLFADAALRSDADSQEGSILIPGYSKVIFDEAHNLEKDATRYFTLTLSAPAVRRVMARIKSKKGTGVFGLVAQLKKFHCIKAGLIKTISDLQEEILGTAAALDDELRIQTRFSEPSVMALPVNRENPLPDFVKTALLAFHRCGEKLTAALSEAVDLLDGEYKGGEADSVIRETGLSVRRIDGLLETAAKFLDFEKDEENIYWLSKERRLNGDFYVQFNITPAEVGPLLEQSLWSAVETAVCTSATLAVGSGFDYFLKTVGLNRFEGERLQSALFPSPFDYKNRVLLAVASGDAPDVTRESDAFNAYAVDFTRRYLKALKGRALLLFTSVAQMNAVFDAVAGDLEESGITALRQGNESRRLLLDRFKKDIGSVLFATDSFWEGVDAPGRTLEHLLIFRLPFRVPDDPVLQARSRRIDERGGRSFFEISVPQAVMRFKQGFGRVMRKKNDRGVVVVLDNRIVTKRSYGALFYRSVPPTGRVIGDPGKIIDTAQKFMERLEEQ